MNHRIILALGVVGLAATAALAVGLWKQLGVKSYGRPEGRVVRAGQQLCVLIQTLDPHMPSLKGRDESRMRYSYALWVIPQAADGDIRTIPLDRGVASEARMHYVGVREFSSGVLWYSIQALRGIDLTSGRETSIAPPAALVNTPISQLMGSSENCLEQYRVKGVALPSGGWLFLATDDEAKTDLKPGKRLYDNPNAVGTYKPRAMYTATVQPGVIPCIAATSLLGGRTFRNGAFMRADKAGDVVRFANPDGFLVVHEDGDPVHPTVRLSRLNIDGTVAWTADTGIGRLTQVLPHERLPAFVGERPQQLVEPLLGVVDLNSGIAKTKSLKGPLN